MKIYSDVLNTADLYEACTGVCGIAEIMTIKKPRKRSKGWQVYLTGSSPYRSQATDFNAATWDEHGIWMRRLFHLDSNAVIASYDGLDDFMEQTRRWKPRNTQAPWLGDDSFVEDHRLS